MVFIHLRMNLLLVRKTALLGYTLGILAVVVWMKGHHKTVKTRALQELQEGLMYEHNTKSLTLLFSSQRTEYEEHNSSSDTQLYPTKPRVLKLRPATLNMCTHEQRRSHISKMCDVVQNNLTWKSARYIFDEKRRLLFCEISKSGCTTWKALWEHANNPSKSLEFYAEYPMMVHSYGYFWSNLSISMAKPPITDMANYTKFLVVRHPFERLLSAYYNIKHFKKRQPGPEKKFREHLSMTFNLTMKESIPKLQMEQYIQYITDRRLSRRHYNDRHIVPYSQSCGVCNISYDYVLRLETNYDAKPIIKRLGYPEDYLSHPFMLNNKREMDTEDSTTRYFKEFRNLPTELLDKLLDRYQYDLKIFGYHYDIKTSKTSCSIKTNDGNTCC